jgi:hypothetical protein
MSDEGRQRLDELESVKGDINSTNNQRQMNARERIARNAEFLAAKEAADQGLEFSPDDGPADDDLSGGVSDSYAVTDETLKSDLAQQPRQRAEPEKPRTYKIKVNGQEVDLSEAELIERAQKVEAADRYLAEKKREADLLLAETRLKLEQLSVTTDVAPEVSDEDLELVRALQVGDEYTAAKALRARLARQTTTQPAISMDAVAAKVKDDLEHANATKWFAQEYKDVVTDPKLMMIANQLDADFRKMDQAEKRVTPYMDRYRAIGEEVRKWKGTSPEFTEKVKRKAETLKTLPQASMKSGSVVEDDDNMSEEEYHQKAIQETARRRYQTHLGG